MRVDDLLREAEDAAIGAAWGALHDALAAHRAALEVVQVIVRNEAPGSPAWREAWDLWRRAAADLRTCWLLRYGRQLDAHRQRPPPEP